MDPHTDPAITLAAILTAVTLGYTLLCWVLPFRPCHRCNGIGRLKPPRGRTLRACRRCKATGRRLRAGRWLYNRLAHLHHEGTR